jgi:hypothetical protein
MGSIVVRPIHGIIIEDIVDSNGATQSSGINIDGGSCYELRQ